MCWHQKSWQAHVTPQWKNLRLLQDEPWLSMETQTLREPICVWVVFRCSKNQISWLTPTLPFATCGTGGSGRIGSCSTANLTLSAILSKNIWLFPKKIFYHNFKSGYWHLKVKLSISIASPARFRGGLVVHMHPKSWGQPNFCNARTGFWVHMDHQPTPYRQF